jgi:cytochrome c biogenesis protein CcmG/thiol:disulfide interchange protein DsbE
LTRHSRLVLATAIALITALAVGWVVWNQLSAPPSIVVSRNPLIDKPVPPLSLPALDGSGTINLADYAGRPVIVNFWASWCAPCRQEFPLFRSAREAHAEEGLEIIGVARDDSVAAAQQFAQDEGANWKLAFDADDTAWRAFGGALMPTSYYIDREGMVRAVSYGPPPAGTLEEQLAKIL